MKLNPKNIDLLDDNRQILDLISELTNLCDIESEAIDALGYDELSALASSEESLKISICDLLKLTHTSYDFYQVEFGHKELIKIVKTEKPIDTWDRLLIDLSSTLGFWLGFSFITLFEVGNYFRLVIYFLIIHVKNLLCYGNEMGKYGRDGYRQESGNMLEDGINCDGQDDEDDDDKDDAMASQSLSNQMDSRKEGDVKDLEEGV